MSDNPRSDSGERIPASEGAEARYCRPKLAVEILEAKANPLFSEEQRGLTRFLRYHGDKMPCAECGKRRSVLWTQLCSFQALDMPNSFGPMKRSGKIHPPLTGVCQSHLLEPQVDIVDEQGNPVPALAAGKEPTPDGGRQSKKE